MFKKKYVNILSLTTLLGLYGIYNYTYQKNPPIVRSSEKSSLDNNYVLASYSNNLDDSDSDIFCQYSEDSEDTEDSEYSEKNQLRNFRLSEYEYE